MTTVTTLESPPYCLTSKKMIWIINRRSFNYVRHAGTSHYALQGFHCRRNSAVPILSLHALCFQIPEIYLQQRNHHCSNSTSHLSSTNYPRLTVHHLPGHWCFPTSLGETRKVHNTRPVVIRTFSNNKGLDLRYGKCSCRQLH